MTTFLYSLFTLLGGKKNTPRVIIIFIYNSYDINLNLFLYRRLEENNGNATQLLLHF